MSVCNCPKECFEARRGRDFRDLTLRELDAAALACPARCPCHRVRAQWCNGCQESHTREAGCRGISAFAIGAPGKST